MKAPIMNTFAAVSASTSLIAPNNLKTMAHRFPLSLKVSNEQWLVNTAENCPPKYLLDNAD